MSPQSGRTARVRIEAHAAHEDTTQETANQETRQESVLGPTIWFRLFVCRFHDIFIVHVFAPFTFAAAARLRRTRQSYELLVSGVCRTCKVLLRTSRGM